jgi:hypothetical protein
VRRIPLFLAALGLAGFLAVEADGRDKAQPAKEPACGEYGTSVHFEKTPSDAAKKALKEEKLVFVLHVSGDFENSDFT